MPVEEGDRERKGRGRSYTETYTYRELTEKSKGEKPAKKDSGIERSCPELRHL